jgi:hypothetical protein
MKEIRMKKAARDQLPHLESDGSVELRHNKMAKRPERESRQETWAGYRFKCENSDICADQQSCQSRHKNRLAACAYFHTKVTKDHDGHNVTEIWFTTTTQSSRKEKNEQTLCGFDDLSVELETLSCVLSTASLRPAFLRHFGAEV